MTRRQSATADSGRGTTMRGTRRIALAAGLWATTALGAASAAAAQAAQPAEQPPSSYDGSQYVDSEGCAFIRAGISGIVSWVPRLSRDRGQLCGFEPTQAVGSADAGTAMAPVYADVPNPLDTRVPGLPSSDEAAAPPVAAPEAPVPVRATVPRRAPPSPAVVAEAPPAARPAPVPQAEPLRLTLAEACRGLTGVQSHIHDGRTGAPVDCGNAGAAMATPVSATEPLRLTLAAICADAAATGRRYVYRDTGAPVACAVDAVPAAPIGAPMALPVGPAVPVAIAASGPARWVWWVASP